MQGLRVSEVLVAQSKVDSQGAVYTPATLDELDETGPHFNFAFAQDQRACLAASCRQDRYLLSFSEFVPR